MPLGVDKAMADIFISYAREDHKRAKGLAEALARQGSRMKDCDPLRGPALKKPRPAKPRFFPLMPKRAGSISTWNEDLRLELGTNGSHA